MTGEYTCRSPRLYSLNFICRKLAHLLDFRITHIPREQNIEAHARKSNPALIWQSKGQRQLAHLAIPGQTRPHTPPCGNYSPATGMHGII